MIDLLATFLLLLALEIVLGVDNILVITILVGRVHEAKRNQARMIGLALAFLLRIVMLLVLLRITGLHTEWFWGLSLRNLVLLGGGMFLIWKAIREIHHTVEFIDEKESHHHRKTAKDNFGSAVRDIVVMDAVFSVDSVITAIGLTHNLMVIVAAVMVSMSVILVFAKPVGDFILERPSLKILALSFLITIGATLFLEGLHLSVPRSYLYLPMGFAIFVELLQMRYERNRQKRSSGKAQLYD